MRNKLKVQRAIHNWTQEDLAKLVSVSRQTINAVEANKYIPSTELALKLAKICQVSVEEIFMLDED